MSKHEYRRLLFDISEKINANELKKMVYLCIDDLPEGTRRDSFEDAIALFDILERKNRLGIDNTQILKGMLQNLPKKSLLRKVEDFEIKRKAQSFGIISSLKRAAGTLSGAVRMVCNFRTLAGGIVLVSTGLALRRCSSFEEYIDVFNKVVLPASTKLVQLSESSLCFTVLAETPSALKELWNIYNSETLKNRLQNFLVTKEIKQLASGEEIEVTVYIDEKEYRAAYLDLMFQQNQAADNISQEGGRRRRNSDSFLSLSSKEDEMTLMLLNQAENKWNFKIQILEIEIDKLKRELAICGEDAGEDKDLQRPQNGRRRHSDLDLYCKERNEEVRERDHEQEQFLGEEKYSFIQKYLEQVHETHSVVTSTGDSGFVTEETASEVGHLEDRAGKYEVAYLPTTYHSCGAVLILTDDDVSNASAIKTFFTDLDSKSDVTEILIQDIPSFRLLNEEINVLILEISARFGNLLEGETQRQTEKSLSLCLSRLKNTLLMLKRRTRQGRREVHDYILRLTHLMHGIVSILRMELKQRDELKSFLQSTMVTAEWIQAKLTELIQSPEWFVIERKEEEENFYHNMSSLIRRWIHRQDDFSFFALFHFSLDPYRRVPEGILSELMSATTNKLKFVVFPFFFATYCAISNSGPETLMTSYDYWDGNLKMLPEILNKRWQTLDVKSMMSELQRSSSGFMVQGDTLSSVHRFKRKEGVTSTGDNGFVTEETASEVGHLEDRAAGEDKDLQRPQNGRRRHSDSDLYCKERNEEVRERDDEQEQFLGKEKYSLIQKYLEQVHETRSVVTSTGDSGFLTEETASEVGHLEDRADPTPRLAHVDPRVFSEIQERFKRDRDASLDEIKKLNEVAYLPTTYHSCGAVLILTDDDVSNASAIKTFFTDLDSKSDVTEILIQDIPSFRHLNEEINVLILEISARFGNLLEGETQRQTEKSLSLCLSRLKNTLLVLKRRTRQGRREVQDDILRLTHLMHGIVSILRMELKQRDELKSFLQSTMVTAERIQAKLTELIQSPEWFVIERKEKEENFRENMSAVINRWIHRQDDFSFFALFHFSLDPYRRVPEGILRKLQLMTATYKLKFVVFPFFFATYCAISNSGPETLMASYDYWDGNLKMLPEILNKRWQTLDVKSMMSELQRSSSGFMVQGDTLSSAHRFKRKEGASLS